MKDFYTKHREIIKYILFGLITTFVSKGVYFLALAFGEYVLGMSPSAPDFYAVRTVAKGLDWVFGVLVAFITNKLWVFESSGTTAKETAGELLKFSGSRVGTGILDLFLSLTIVYVMNALSYQPFTFIFEFTPDLWSQIVSSIVIIVTNYLISKYFIFKKK